MIYIHVHDWLELKNNGKHPQWFSSRDYEHCQTFLELKIEALSHLLPTLAQQKKIPILLHITLTPTITFFKAT